MPAKNSRFWTFTDEDGSFEALEAQRLSRLYFPLANPAGMMSAVTPDLHGDIKRGLNAFLTQPISEQDLHLTRCRRDFWVRAGADLWLANASSGDAAAVQAGFLWHKLTREKRRMGLKAEITNFVPSSDDTVELMEVRLTNTGRQSRRISATAAVPIFGRSADNVRDHRHVTSLLHRISPHKHGVTVTPTMSFDERGHTLNKTTYAVLGFEEKGRAPLGSFPTVEEFIGEGGDLDRPRAVVEHLPPKRWNRVAGQEAMGALRFREVTLKPGASISYILVLGVTDDRSQLNAWAQRYGNAAKFANALADTRAFWRDKLNQLRFITGDADFTHWLRWVSLQPSLRKIFGNSFLPDFDYGRGGRGWRDLWQDCLALLLQQPQDARQLLLNNFGGVRIDGSNATIIGRSPGEFIADRNNITRVWMDHGVWPFLTTELYIHQSGDFSILLEKIPYFRDPQLRRAKAKDAAWTEAYGRQLKTFKGQIYAGTVLEHILVQHLVAFFHVGEHNMIRLEDADWNDGLDMAHHRGESVAFTAQYAGNLSSLAALLRHWRQSMGVREVRLARELLLLLDRARGDRVHYPSPDAKRQRLERYFDAACKEVSGDTVEVSVDELVADLEEKAKHLGDAVRQQEWLGGWFNGYYDDQGRRVEGRVDGLIRMTLTGQVFPILSGVATPAQVADQWKSVGRHLRDRLGGFRLNTDFGEIQPALGRAFSFAYGEKENGAFFNHMIVMFANGLYRRGFVAEGREVLRSIFRMAANTDRSKIYPGLPEYFNNEGRGLYHYLTGSASWFVLTYLTQVCGVRGHWGDLLLAPQLSADEFGKTGTVEVHATFAGKRLRVVYNNPQKLEAGRYAIEKVTVNGMPQTTQPLSPIQALITRLEVSAWEHKSPLTVEVVLGKAAKTNSK